MQIALLPGFFSKSIPCQKTAKDDNVLFRKRVFD